MGGLEASLMLLVLTAKPDSKEMDNYKISTSLCRVHSSSSGVIRLVQWSGYKDDNVVYFLATQSRAGEVCFWETNRDVSHM